MTRVFAIVLVVLGAVVMATAFGAGPAGAVRAADGAALFVTKGCAACHSAPGIVAMIEIGPNLSSAPPSREYLRRSIIDPAADVAPRYRQDGGAYAGMPDLGLSEPEVDELVELLLGEA